MAVAPVDTLFVMTPAGRVEASRTGDQIDRTFFCGNADDVVLTDWASSGPRFLRWNWRTGEERVFSADVLQAVDCSPNGTAALVWVAYDRTERLGVLNLLSGGFHDLGLDPAGYSRLLPVWLSDGGPPVPAELALEADSLIEVDWGGVDSLLSTLTLSDGDTGLADIAWSSSDSSVATVTTGNQLRGNRPGSALARGCVNDWICDSTWVRVRGIDTEAQLFEDGFDGPLDTANWILFGEPVPHTVDEPGGDRVLFLNGDGAYLDGILSRETFSLAQGATLEIEFRYRGGLRRTDRQTAVFCLTRYDLQGEPVAWMDNLEITNMREAVCFTYPADESRRFDPSVASFSRIPSRTNDRARVPGALPPIDWTHVAIQVVPDSRASLFLNHRPVAELRLRLSGTANNDWRIELAGHSVDTRLEVRNVTLWMGERY